MHVNLRLASSWIYECYTVKEIRMDVFLDIAMHLEHPLTYRG